MNRIQLRVAGLLALLLTLAATVGVALAVPPPTVSVTNVTLGASNVCVGTGSFSVGATVTPTYRSPLSDTDSPSKTTPCNAGNSFCGAGSLATTVACKRTRVQTSYTVEGSVSATANDGFTLDTALSGPSPAGGTFTGTLAEPTLVADDEKTVTVNASVQDDMVGSVTTTVSYWTGTGTAACNGTQVGSDVVTPSTTHDVQNGDGAGNATYVLDINPPTLNIQSVTDDPIAQDSDQGVHTKIDDGSAIPGTGGGPDLGQPYTLKDTVTGPGPTSYSFTSSGLRFHGDGNGDGMAPPKNDTLAVHIPACAPPGTYAAFSELKADDICGTVDAYTVDAGNNGVKEFEVTGVASGISLNVQTGVVAELPPFGDYGNAQCFLSSQNVNKKKIIVNNYPGSVHITSTINAVDGCGGGTPDPSLKYKPTTVVLTLPSDFSFSDTGASPRAHVFIGPSDPGFDLHYPTDDPLWTEITDLVTQIKAPATDTINFDTPAFNAAYPDGVGADQTIYIRAHTRYTGGTAAGSPETFIFSSQAQGTDADNNDLDSGVQTYDLIANPDTQACVDGTLEDLP